MSNSGSLDLGALRALAEKAKEDPRRWFTKNMLERHHNFQPSDAQFVEAVSPVTILVLIRRLEAAEKLARDARKVLNSFGPDDEPHIDDDQDVALSDLAFALHAYDQSTAADEGKTL